MGTRSLAVALVLLSAAQSGCATNPFPNDIQKKVMEPARTAENAGDHETALLEYQRAADDGIPLAQYRLGRMYERGLGTAKDDGQAARWYRASSDAGYPQAQIALGNLYDQGRGVPKDSAAALALFRKVAEYEQSYAYRLKPARPPAVGLYKTGELIERGRGTKADPAAAAGYYQIAAKVGNPDAQFALAELYRKGNGVVADPAEAERWYAAAAKSYAGADDARAQERLGQMYLDGRGVPKEVMQGVLLLERAAQQGRTSAQVRLAQVYERGTKGLPPDQGRAVAYYQIAADAGHAGALYALAGLHATGNGVQRDGRRAVELYQQAAAAGERKAYRKLGDLYADGKAVSQDYAEANKWFAESAKDGDGHAAFRLGKAYEQGLGVTPDPAQALTWYRVAQTLGEDRSAERIERLSAQPEPAQAQEAVSVTEAGPADRASP